MPDFTVKEAVNSTFQRLSPGNNSCKAAGVSGEAPPVWTVTGNHTRNLMELLPGLDPLLFQHSCAVCRRVIKESKDHPWSAVLYDLHHYVACISTIILTKSGGDTDAQSKICLGALLHDIGKLLVPREIIQKPDKLDKHEIAIMKRHCELGYEMARKSGLPPDCADIILQHHERMDGSGYPNGMTAERISESAKIVMVADAMDAILSYRPYKAAAGVETGINVLRKEKTKYDPDCVRLLMQCLSPP